MDSGKVERHDCGFYHLTDVSSCVTIPIDMKGGKKIMQAFNNDPEIQKKYIARVQAHYDADEIIQGVYWEKGKGCAVGCTIENDDVKKSGGSWHKRYEEALGVPRILARLEDRIFEGLSNGEAKDFPLRFIKAMPLGADLSLVFYKFMHWLLVDPEDGVIKFAREDGKKAIQNIADLFQRKINGEEINFDTWMTARRAAADAAAYAADAAAADADAAYADADAAYADAAAAYAADAAAYAAYAADAADAKRSHYKKMADKLIALLEEAK